MKRTKRLNLLINLNITVFTTLLMFALLEIVARVILPPAPFDPSLPFPPFRDQYYQVKLRGVSPVIHFTTNQWGFRGDAPPHDWNEYYTIVTVGGSTTHCFFLDDAQTWPALLQGRLQASYSKKIWIGNAGVDGHSTLGNILVMDKVIRAIHPKAVIILVGVNDLGVSLSESESRTGNPYDGLTTATYRFQSQLFQILGLLRDKLRKITEPAAHQNFMPVIVEPSELTPLPDDLSTLMSQLPDYRRNLEHIVDLAQELHVQVLFMTQPMLFDDTEYWRGIRGTIAWISDPKYSLSAATVWRMMQIYNQSLLNMCERRHIACYDLASRIPHDERYFYDSVHFTEAGSALVAQETEKAVLENLLPQKRANP